MRTMVRSAGNATAEGDKNTKSGPFVSRNRQKTADAGVVVVSRRERILGLSYGSDAAIRWVLEGRSPPLEDPERCSCRCTKARAKGQAGCGSLPSPESRAPSGQKEQDERRYAWRRSRSNCVLQACKRMRGVGRMQHLVPSVLCWCGPGGWAGEGWG